MDFGRLFHLHEFRFRWHTYTGSEFQQLFADVMQNAWQQDFQKIRPYGARGDLKCDGYWRSQRCVFQCYGPVSMREAVVIRKIEEDLPGAITHWHGRMARWAFVHNQREGLTAKVVQLLDDLRMEYPTLQIEEWTWPQIRTHFDRTLRRCSRGTLRIPAYDDFSPPTQLRGTEARRGADRQGGVRPSGRTRQAAI